MWYPTYYPLVSNSLGKKSRTILISVTLLLPSSRKVRCIDKVRTIGRGRVGPAKSVLAHIGGLGAGGVEL